MTSPADGNVALSIDLIDAMIRGDTTVEFEPVIGEPASAPDAEQVRRWAQILESGDGTPQWWLTVAASVRNADDDIDPTHPDDDTHHRGGYGWCERAANTYEWLSEQDQTPSGREPGTDACWADPDVIAVWLTTPGLYDDDPARTPADLLDVGVQFDGSDVLAFPALQDLLVEAQDAGVWGIPGHRIDVHYTIDRDEQFGGYLFVTRPYSPSGGSWVSDPLFDHELADTYLTGIDAATAVLTNAATAVNRSLAADAPDTITATTVVTEQADADMRQLMQSMQRDPTGQDHSGEPGTPGNPAAPGPATGGPWPDAPTGPQPAEPDGQDPVYRISPTGKFHPPLYPDPPVEAPRHEPPPGRAFPPLGPLPSPGPPADALPGSTNTTAHRRH